MLSYLQLIFLLIKIWSRENEYEKWDVKTNYYCSNIRNGYIYLWYLWPMLFFLCLNFGLYEYNVTKKYKENINMTICCMSSALFAVLWSIKFSKEIQSINLNAYRPYAQAGIIIFMFMAGIFYLFYKKEKIKSAEYKILDDNDAENKTDAKTLPFITQIYEAILGSINGLTIVLFLIAYSLILSI